VTVGCDVVLGPRSILLAGARVADGTRLGAASIVNREKDVP
jgi:acetyltransferase-like isoleucine patch superfamily enzyme